MKRNRPNPTPSFGLDRRDGANLRQTKDEAPLIEARRTDRFGSNRNKNFVNRLFYGLASNGKFLAATAAGESERSKNPRENPKKARGSHCVGKPQLAVAPHPHRTDGGLCFFYIKTLGLPQGSPKKFGPPRGNHGRPGEEGGKRFICSPRRPYGGSGPPSCWSNRTHCRTRKPASQTYRSARCRRPYQR